VTKKLKTRRAGRQRRHVSGAPLDPRGGGGVKGILTSVLQVQKRKEKKTKAVGDRGELGRLDLSSEKEFLTTHVPAFHNRGWAGTGFKGKKHEMDWHRLGELEKRGTISLRRGGGRIPVTFLA